jgi:hypothetical protein
MGDGWSNLSAELAVQAPGYSEGLARTTFTQTHLVHSWMSGSDIRMVLYAELGSIGTSRFKAKVPRHCNVSRKQKHRFRASASGKQSWGAWRLHHSAGTCRLGLKGTTGWQREQEADRPLESFGPLGRPLRSEDGLFQSASWDRRIDPPPTV